MNTKHKYHFKCLLQKLMFSKTNIDNFNFAEYRETNISKEKFDVLKWIISIRTNIGTENTISRKNHKRANIDIQNTTQKIKD